MSLSLLIDADTQDSLLVQALRTAGHDVQTVNEVGLRTALDPAILEYSIASDRILCTRNAEDFRAMHETNPKHPGIFVIYSNNDPRRDMGRAIIVRAINNLERSGLDLRGQFIALNDWQF